MRPLTPTTPLFALALLLGGCASGAGAPAAPVPSGSTSPLLLRWQWSEGETLRYRVRTETDLVVASEALGEPMRIRTDQVMELVHEVESVEADGSATIVQRLEALDLEMDAPGGESISWSSSDPDAASGADAAGLEGLLVGHPVRVRLDPRGRVLGIEGLEDLLDTLVSGMAESPEEESLLRATIGETASADALARLAEESVLPLPEGAVAPGDTWSRESRLPIPMLGEIEHRQRYALERIEGDTAVIVLESTLDLGGEGSSAALPGLPAEVEAMMDLEIETRRGEISGRIRFDAARGRIVLQELTTRLDVRVTLTPKGELAERQEPMVMELEAESLAVQELVAEPD